MDAGSGGAPTGEAGICHAYGMLELIRRSAPGLLLWLALPSPAFAYIDPTAGGLMLQTLIAGAFGLAFWFRDALASLARRLMGRGPKG